MVGPSHARISFTIRQTGNDLIENLSTKIYHAHTELRGVGVERQRERGSRMKRKKSRRKTTI